MSVINTRSILVWVPIYRYHYRPITSILIWNTFLHFWSLWNERYGKLTMKGTCDQDLECSSRHAIKDCRSEWGKRWWPLTFSRGFPWRRKTKTLGLLQVKQRDTDGTCRASTVTLCVCVHTPFILSVRTNSCRSRKDPSIKWSRYFGELCS